MQRVLIVAHAYPPCNIAGAIRPSKFVRYLPQFGWEPIVLTAADSTTSEDLPPNANVEVYRVREWPHPLKVYYRFSEQRAQKRGRAEEFAAQMSSPYNGVMSSPKRGVAQFKQWLVDLMQVPDQELGWLIPAISKGVWLIRQKKITHLVTTSPPYTSQLIGLALKRLTGVRWVADFRDPWALKYRIHLHRSKLTNTLEAKLVQWVMESADLVLSVTPLLTEEARKEHPTVKPEKFVTLTNGFDSADFDGLPMNRPIGGPTIFSYIGSYYLGHSPELFLHALRDLLDDGQIRLEDVKVRFVGDVDLQGGFLANMIERLGLEKIVSVCPPVPLREAMRLNIETHVAIVFTEPYPFSSKVYPALAAGATILNIGSCGGMTDLLARTGRGVAVDHTSVAEIRKGILGCIRRSRSEASKTALEPWRDPAIQCFNFEKLTGRLAELLEGLDRTKMSGMDGQRI